jgi:hypothetical protein
MFAASFRARPAVRVVPDKRDQNKSADKFGQDETPAQQKPKHDAELDHEIGGGEHEGERGNHRCALLNRASSRGRGRVRTRTAGCTQAGRDRNGFESCLAESAAHLLSADENLERSGNSKAEDQRPERRPEHGERVIQTHPDHFAISPAPPWFICSREGRTRQKI